MRRAALVTGGLLIALSLWAFVAVEKFSPTALIPGGFGVAVIICGLGLARWPGLVWLVVLLLLTLAAALLMPFRSAVEDSDLWGMIRVGAMIIVSMLGALGLARALRHGA